MHHILMFMPLLALVLFLFLPWPVALALYIPLVAISLFGYWKVLQALHQPPVTGTQTMLGDRAVVVKERENGVEVHHRGETWHAVSSQPLHVGQEVIIEDVEGLTLHVAPLPQPQNEALNGRVK